MEGGIKNPFSFQSDLDSNQGKKVDSPGESSPKRLARESCKI